MRYRFVVLLPLLLICGAAAAATIVTYGTDAGLARFSHGIQLIMWSRRLEWPLILLCLALCVALLALIISGRRRAWWLIGLAVVLALFVRNFSSLYRPPIHLIESAPFVDVEHASGVVGASEYVVGFRFSGKYYALPYHQLTAFPLLLLSEFDQRAVVIWSVTANAVTVLPLEREAFPRDLEVVSAPADSLLLFDRRFGEFIVGVTGQTVAGARPIGFGEPIPVEKLPLEKWAAMHPETQVMAFNITTGAPITPARPLLHFPTDSRAANSICLLATTQPVALPSEQVVAGIHNFNAGKTSVLLIRESGTSSPRAFDRQTKDDLFLTLQPTKHPDRKHPTGVMTDVESRSLWTSDCRAIDGPLKGTQLREIGLRDGLYWGVMKFWMPQLQWMEIR